MATTMMATRRQVSPEEIAEVWKEFKADPKNKALRNRLIEKRKVIAASAIPDGSFGRTGLRVP